MSTATFSQAGLEHLDALYSYALILTRDQTAAEDLVQETYLRAVRAFGQLMPNSNLKSCLFGKSLKAWLNHIRHSPREPRFVALDDKGVGFFHQNDRENKDPHGVYLVKLRRVRFR